MRVALVSPYSWTYPGGVTRHIEALAAELDAAGHDVRVLAPFDDDVRRTALLHRGARPQARERPDWLVPLGPTIGRPSPGAVPWVAPSRCSREARPPHMAAVLLGARRKLNRLSRRIAVSEAAAWTGRRFYGGRYTVVPNGVVLPEGGPAAPRPRAPGEPLRIAFVGQAVERKGLPVLLRAFEALRGQVPAELTIVGATQEEVAPLLVDGGGVTALGRIDDDARHAALVDADVLCAPSLGR